jgi:DNA cross-link repair 1A protein
LFDSSCPGSNMFLFRFPNGKLILHTGDFRAASHLLTHPLLQPNQIDTIYLDTTYIFLFIYLFFSIFN